MKVRLNSVLFIKKWTLAQKNVCMERKSE